MTAAFDNTRRDLLKGTLRLLTSSGLEPTPLASSPNKASPAQRQLPGLRPYPQGGHDMEDPTQVLPARVAKHVTVRPSEPRGPAVGRQGRSSTYYKQVAAEYAKGQYPCHLCGIRPGVWTDHVPPLADFPHHSLWRGKLMPSCQPCQSRQGARITNERRGTARPTSRAW